MHAKYIHLQYISDEVNKIEDEVTNLQIGEKSSSLDTLVWMCVLDAVAGCFHLHHLETEHSFLFFHTK